MFVMLLYKMVLTFESPNKILNYSMTIQMKAIEQYFPVCGVVYYAVQGGSNFLVQKIGNFGLKSNGKVIFRKFRSEIG